MVAMNHLLIGRDYTLQTSSDLTSWNDVQTFTASAGTNQVTQSLSAERPPSSTGSSGSPEGPSENWEDPLRFAPPPSGPATVRLARNQNRVSLSIRLALARGPGSLGVLAGPFAAQHFRAARRTRSPQRSNGVQLHLLDESAKAGVFVH